MRDIKKIVSSLKKKFNTNNPFEICEALDIWVYIIPLGNVKGHYTYSKRKKVFFINENLNEQQRKFCCAHELGHALMHAKSNSYFNSTNTFIIQSKFERQADEFASELIIDDFLINYYEGHSLEFISKAENIELDYLNLKFNK